MCRALTGDTRGPASGNSGRDDHPVTHVTYEDAAGYAAWSGAALPSEVEWEFAARGWLNGSVFAWGDEQHPAGELMANFWQGDFPWRNTGARRWRGTSPVGVFPANGYGLYDVTGNVWGVDRRLLLAARTTVFRRRVLCAAEPTRPDSGCEL
jgi:sulfatase modifying factor 1